MVEGSGSGPFTSDTGFEDLMMSIQGNFSLDLSSYLPIVLSEMVEYKNLYDRPSVYVTLFFTHYIFVKSDGRKKSYRILLVILFYLGSNKEKFFRILYKSFSF